MNRAVDERQRGSRRAANQANTTAGWSSPDQPQHGVLALQRQIGNAGVTRMLQRTPKDRPATTDAPGVKKRPPAKPAKKLPDIHTRVIKADIAAGKTRIMIAAGPDQGVQKYMSGQLLKSDGSKYMSFMIEATEGGTSTAFVDTTLDDVRAHSQVLIKASDFVSMEGKEF